MTVSRRLRAGAAVAAAALLPGLAACGGADAGHNRSPAPTESSRTPADSSEDDPDSPDADDASEAEARPRSAGRVTFDLRGGGSTSHPAVRDYRRWQVAATTALRERELNPQVLAGSRALATEVVRESLGTVVEGDYTVSRTMIGRVRSVRTAGDTTMMQTCLWRPSFDYRDDATGRPVDGTVREWLDVDVLLVDRDGTWIVSDLTTNGTCRGGRP